MAVEPKSPHRLANIVHYLSRRRGGVTEIPRATTARHAVTTCRARERSAREVGADGRREGGSASESRDGAGGLRDRELGSIEARARRRRLAASGAEEATECGIELSVWCGRVPFSTTLLLAKPGNGMDGLAAAVVGCISHVHRLYFSIDRAGGVDEFGA